MNEVTIHLIVEACYYCCSLPNEFTYRATRVEVRVFSEYESHNHYFLETVTSVLNLVNHVSFE